MPPILVYRTAGDWGGGKGSPLAPSEVDQNFRALEQAVSAAEHGSGVPVTIDRFEVEGAWFTAVLTDAGELGPFPLPLSVLRWRGEWAPATAYETLDVVVVVNDGVYAIRVDHVSAATFDAETLAEDRRRIYGALVTIDPGDLTGAGTVTGTAHTLGLDDARRLLNCTAGGGCAVTVPRNTTVDFARGTEIALRQGGAGPVEILPGPGVALNPVEGRNRESAFRGGVVHVKKVGTNTWDLFGDLAQGEPPTEEEPFTEAPTEPQTEAPTEAPTEPPTETPTEAGTEAPTEVPTEAGTEAPTEPATEPPTEAGTEAPTEPSSEPPWWLVDTFAADSPSGTSTTHTLPMDFGAAHEDRRLILALNWGRQSTTGGLATTGVTIGGVTARRVARGNKGTGSLHNAEIWIADVPTGTSGNVVITMSSSIAMRFVAALYRDTSVRRNPAWAIGDTGTDIGGTLAAVPGGGAVVAACNRATNATPANTGVTGVSVLDISEAHIDGGSQSHLKGSAASRQFGDSALTVASTATMLAGAVFRRGPEPHDFFRAHLLSTTSASGTSTTTIASGIPLGAAAAGRMIVVVHEWTTSSLTGQLASMTLTPNDGDPVALTKAVGVNASNGTRNSEIWYGIVPTGTTCSIGIAHTTAVRTVNRHSLTIYALPDMTGLTAPVFTATDTDDGGAGADTEVGLAEPGAFYAVGGASLVSGGHTVNLGGVGTIDAANHVTPELSTSANLNGVTGSGIGGAGGENISGNVERLALAAWNLPFEDPTEPEEPTEGEEPTEPPEPGQLAAVLTDHVTGEGPAFADVDLGPADDDRMIVLAIARASVSGAAVREITAAAVGATSLTRAVRSDSDPSLVDAEIWYGNVAAGTSATVTLTLSSAPFGALATQAFSIAVYSVIGLEGEFAPVGTAADDAFEADTATVSVDQAGGFALVAAAGRTLWNRAVPVDLAGADADTPRHSVIAAGQRRLNARQGSAATVGGAQEISAVSHHGTDPTTGESTLTGFRLHLAAAVWPAPPP